MKITSFRRTYVFCICLLFTYAGLKNIVRGLGWCLFMVKIIQNLVTIFFWLIRQALCYRGCICLRLTTFDTVVVLCIVSVVAENWIRLAEFWLLTLEIRVSSGHCLRPPYVYMHYQWNWRISIMFDFKIFTVYRGPN